MKTIDPILHDITGSQNKSKRRSIVSQKREHAKQQLLQDLTEMSETLQKPVPADDNWHRAKEVKAVPLSRLKQYLNIEGTGDDLL